MGPSLALHRADLHQAMLVTVGDVPIQWGHALRPVDESLHVMLAPACHTIA
jgi:hypothetical protein